MTNVKEYFVLYGKFYLVYLLFSAGLLGLFFLHSLPLEPFIDYAVFSGVILGGLSLFHYFRYAQKRKQLQHLLRKERMTEVCWRSCRPLEIG